MALRNISKLEILHALTSRRILQFIYLNTQIALYVVWISYMNNCTYRLFQPNQGVECRRHTTTRLAQFSVFFHSSGCMNENQYDYFPLGQTVIWNNPMTLLDIFAFWQTSPSLIPSVNVSSNPEDASAPLTPPFVSVCRIIQFFLAWKSCF